MELKIRIFAGISGFQPEKIVGLGKVQLPGFNFLILLFCILLLNVKQEIRNEK
jgi:hypothetical protein